jgi:hypothetical protein
VRHEEKKCSKTANRTQNVGPLWAIDIKVKTKLADVKKETPHQNNNANKSGRTQNESQNKKKTSQDEYHSDTRPPHTQWRVREKQSLFTLQDT